MANTCGFTSRDQLPLYLNADQVASVVGISRAKAYTLMHSEGFPTTRIGKRMIVSRDALLTWLSENTGN